MRLLAISDLHLGFGENRRAIEALAARPDDWLILAGDTGETIGHLEFACRTLAPRFARIIWAPGNHDLWALPGDSPGLRGDARYERLVTTCRRYGILTPEDPYPLWPGDGPAVMIAPLFLLYDYSFRPDDVPDADAVKWASESGVLCADERYLHPDPHASRRAWCQARCRETEARLEAVPPGLSLVLVNHFPLRRDLVRLPAIPRFSIWCGTRRTEDWHVRFPVRVVVSGHLHLRATDWRDGVRFEEVSLGYPRQWQRALGAGAYLRTIL
jgi:predicted phosphodiesterase